MSKTFTLGTHNLYRGKAKAHKIADIIGFQEANDHKIRQTIRASLGDEYRWWVPEGEGAAAVPIAYDAGVFERIGQGSRQTHGGKAKVTPARYVNWVILRHKATSQTVAFFDTHFISGAWSRLRPNTAWRREMWRIHLEVLRDLVNNVSSKADFVYIVGDMNRSQWLNLGSKFHHAKVTAVRVPYDQIHSNAPISAARRGPGYGSDHPTWTATATLHNTDTEPPPWWANLPAH